ncbi:MAG: beta-ketoacyl-[acyl-carrier-protein] synthase family protein [Candidatus Omnitrophica bacterium]|nr:beta-ketoacyl-[acyl-carrier-protein] synthase family protein [Candidatus Omnitrophota bacterium]
MRDSKRVVVTGIGIISSIGIGREAFWRAAVSGTSGISKVSSFNTSEFKHHYGGEIKNFDPIEFIDKRRLRFLSRTSQFAIAASRLAIEDAKLNLKQLPNYKTGVIMGTTMGESTLEEAVKIWVNEGIRKVSKVLILQSILTELSSNIGINFRCFGPNLLIPTACAAGNYAIGYGFDLIKNGELDMVFAGGADAFSKLAFSGFQRLYAMAPEKCQPFDKNRKGIIVGEGSGVLLLENLGKAFKRKANIYAEIVGYGLSCDAYHITAPKAEGIIKAMKKAVKNADINIEEVDYICAHGTGTVQNDKTESLAIKTLFNERYKKIPVSSLKSMLGHTMGASSAIEAAACCLAAKYDLIPPTINFETPDPDCDIDCVPNIARKKVVNTVLNNGFAFGGNNCCLVLKKYN